MMMRFLVLVLILVLALPIVAQEQPNAQVIWMDSRLLVHVQPYLDSPAVGSLEAGELIIVLGRSRDTLWLQTSADNGVEGWVATEFVRVVDMSSLPITHERNIFGMSAELSPEVIDNIHVIYETGQAMGNRPNVFAKVGDSITAAPNVFFPIGEGNFELGAFSHLNPVIQYYSTGQTRVGNSFSNESLAAAIGWSAPVMFMPRYANTSYCAEGETPLACEYRINMPSIALIMFGTNDVAHFDRSSYYYHMERIIVATIELGIIPIVSTIPQREGYEGAADEFNEVIVSLTNHYQIPIWDYAAAMANLPDFGLGPDGVHPSIPPHGVEDSAYFDTSHLLYGYNIRNLTGLMILDSVWQALEPLR
jgi:hypothetical protein